LHFINNYQIKILSGGEIMMTEPALKKEDAHRLIDQLPPNATWDDLMHEIYILNTIERGLSDSKAGRTKDITDIRKKYSLPE
jgi:hypothetical protein